MAQHKTPTFISSARELQIVDSTINVVGGDVHNHYYDRERPKDIWTILRQIPNFRSIYHDMLSKATPGTGMWLLKGDKFRIWLEPNGDIKIFWGSGIPGAGKTLLATLVIEYLEALRLGKTDVSICVCYFYFRYSDRADVTVRHVLEVIVKQTFERHPDCRALVEQTYARHLHEGSEPTEAQLLDLLRQLNDSISCTFYILDALDEAPSKIQLAVVRVLASLDVKLFITSRPLKTVEANFPQAQTFSIVAQDADIDLHIAKVIKESAELQSLFRRAGSSLREEIISTIKQNCGGMFLHAALQLDALCECLSAHEVRATLKAFPSRIDDVYLRTWTRILNQSRSHASFAKSVLVWVLNAPRSMTIEEIECAIAICPDTHIYQSDRLVPGTTLMSLCRGLVSVEEESRLVRLVHYTAKDTLEGLLHESFPHPHSFLAAVCMTHLVESGFQNSTISSEEEYTAILEQDPLLAYASEAWPYHARESLEIDDSRKRITQFVVDSNAFPMQTTIDRFTFFDILSTLHLLAFHHLPLPLIKDTVVRNPNATTRIHQQSPLIVASQSGHKDFVTRIIAFSDLEVNAVDVDGCSALMFAAHGGHSDIVAPLLYHGAHLNLVDKHGWSALMLAAHAGHEAVIRLLLLSPEVEVNIVNDSGWSALMLAACEGHEDAVKLFLTYPGILINQTNRHGSTALMLAANEGHETIVAVLLMHPGIQVELADSDRSTALMLAANGGHEGVVKLLLAYAGINVNHVNEEGWSALMVAAYAGHEGVVGLIVAHPDTLVNLVDSEGSSALMPTAFAGHEGTIRLLLSAADIDVNLIDDDGNTAMKIVAGQGHEAIVRMLLEVPNIDTTIRSTLDGHTAMSAAYSNGHTVIFELLRDFESQKLDIGAPEEYALLGSDSDGSDVYHDAEEGW